MKPILCLASLLCAALLAGCVAASDMSAQPAVPVAMAPAGPLDELVAPVALYPDALLALVLPAATASSDIVLAARYLNTGGDPAQVETQPWDDSVKGLAHYPDVVKWMDENLAWTQRVGDAYLSNPAEVMAAVQRVRAQARANGLLVDTPQQQVIIDGSYIRIIPAQADVIYVPRYDPEIIYVERPVYYASDPWLTFGLGFGVGWWLNNDCDWGHHTIVVNPHRGSHWQGRHDWRQPEFAEHDWHPWRPAPGRPRPTHREYASHRDVRPMPPPGAPRWDHQRDGRPDTARRHEQPSRPEQTKRPDHPDYANQDHARPDGRPEHAAAPAKATPDTRHTRPTTTPDRAAQQPKPPRPTDQEHQNAGGHARPGTRPPSSTQPPAVEPPPVVAQPQPKPAAPRQGRDDRPQPTSTAQHRTDRPATPPGSHVERPVASRPAPTVQQPAAPREVRPPPAQPSRPPEVRQERSAPAMQPPPPPARRDPSNDNKDNGRNNRDHEPDK